MITSVARFLTINPTSQNWGKKQERKGEKQKKPLFQILKLLQM
jgi:hypothetical protein